MRRPAGEGAGPPQVVFTTESGRVLVNAALYRGVKVVPQARPLPEQGRKAKPRPPIP